MSLRTEYDAWHQRIYEAAPEHEDASCPWYRLVREHFGVSSLRVLEVACGRGGFVRELARAGARVIGCDFSSSTLHAAATKVFNSNGHPPLATLVQGDAQSLPFADASFDLVVSCEPIEHLPQVLAAIREMHRVTRPGEKLFLTPNYANFMGLYEIYARFRHPGRKDDQPFDRRQWFLQIRKWICQAGWTILFKVLSPLAYTYFIATEKTEPAV